MGSGQGRPALSPPVRVVIDHRERGSAAARALEERQGLAVEYAELRTGDYLVPDRAVFERKTIRDFAQSVIDGRLFQQAGRLAGATIPGIVVIEGGLADFAAVGMGRDAMQGALISLTVVFGVPVLRSRDGDETARLILYTAAQIDRVARGWSGSTGYRPKGHRRQQLRVLQSLPGIGPRRAEALLDAFGSVRAIVAAAPASLAAVHGVGDTTAEKIERVLRESAAPLTSDLAPFPPIPAATRPALPSACGDTLS